MPSASSLPISSTPERPRLLSDRRRNATREARADAGRWTLRSSSPGARQLRASPVTNSATGTVRLAPPGPSTVATPSRAAQSEIMGPAGREVQRLPPTVDMFQTLKEATNESQHGRISSSAGQAAACARPVSPAGSA